MSGPWFPFRLNALGTAYEYYNIATGLWQDYPMGTYAAIVVVDNVFYVASNGNDVTGDGSIVAPLLTIGAANTAAVAAGGSSTIVVGPGTFEGDTLAADVSIIGAGVGITIIDTTDLELTVGGVAVARDFTLSGIDMVAAGEGLLENITSDGTLTVSDSVRCHNLNFAVTVGPALTVSPALAADEVYFYNSNFTSTDIASEAVVHTEGTLSLIETLTTSSNAGPGFALLSSGGVLRADGGAVLNIGGGDSISCNNDGIIGAPNILNSVSTVGNIASGTAVTTIRNIGLGTRVTGTALAVEPVDKFYQVTFVGAAAAGYIVAVIGTAGYTVEVGDYIISCDGYVTATGVPVAQPVIGTDFERLIQDDGGTPSVQQLAVGDLSTNTYVAILSKP